MHYILTAAFMYCAPTNLESIIHELQPKVDQQFAKDLAQELCLWSFWYRADPRLTLAIAMQESSLKPDAVSPTGDVTIFQFSPQTIKAYKFNRILLKKDLRYQVYCHFTVLQDKLTRCPGKNGWSCYHSVTPKLRKTYEHQVLRYYKTAS